MIFLSVSSYLIFTLSRELLILKYLTLRLEVFLFLSLLWLLYFLLHSYFNSCGPIKRIMYY